MPGYGGFLKGMPGFAVIPGNAATVVMTVALLKVARGLYSLFRQGVG